MGRAPFLIAAGSGGSQFMLDVATPIFVHSFSVSGKEQFPSAVHLSDDGTKLFITGSINESVHSYDLATAFDLTTATFVYSFHVAIYDPNPRGVHLSSDGTKLFIVGSDSASVYRFDLSAAFDLSTASYVSQLDISAKESFPYGFHLSDDGTKLFIIGTASASVHRYDLGTAWDLPSATFISSLDVSTIEASPAGVHLTNDGTKLFIVGIDSDRVRRFDLGTAWDLPSAVSVSSFDVSTKETAPRGLHLTNDGTKLFIVGSDSDSVHRYDL